MDNTDLISVIIPVYNAFEYLDACIQSVTRQSYENIQIILVNDGSTDNSADICDKYAKLDNRIHVIHQQNKGVSNARNTGIAEALGKYICFIDSDDCISKDMILLMHENMQPDALSVCNYSISNDLDKGILQHKWDVKKYDFNKEFILEYFTEDMEKSIAYSVCNKLFDREVIKNNELLFNEALSIGEDMAFLLSYLSCINTIHFVNEILYYYTVHTASSYNNPSKDYMGDYEKLTEYFLNVQFESHHSDNNDFKEKNKNERNITIVDCSVIACWCFKVLRILFQSGYVRSLDNKRFRQYMSNLKKSNIFKCAIQCKRAENLQRNIFLILVKLRLLGFVHAFRRLKST